MPEVVPIACSLKEAELPARAELIAALGRDLQRVHAEGPRASFGFSAGRRTDLEEFVRAESECCPFFTFVVIEELDRVRLDVSAPEDGDWAVRALVAGFVAGWGGPL